MYDLDIALLYVFRAIWDRSIKYRRATWHEGLSQCLLYACCCGNLDTVNALWVFQGSILMPLVCSFAQQKQFIIPPKDVQSDID